VQHSGWGSSQNRRACGGARGAPRRVRCHKILAGGPQGRLQVRETGRPSTGARRRRIGGIGSGPRERGEGRGGRGEGVRRWVVREYVKGGQVEEGCGVKGFSKRVEETTGPKSVEAKKEIQVGAAAITTHRVPEHSQQPSRRFYWHGVFIPARPMQRRRRRSAKRAKSHAASSLAARRAAHNHPRRRATPTPTPTPHTHTHSLTYAPTHACETPPTTSHLDDDGAAPCCLACVLSRRP
jgi:hypothetical protein